MGVQKGAHPVRVMLGQLPQPPGNRLLDEPAVVFNIAGGPAQHAVADGKLMGLGVVLFGPGQGDDQRGAARPHMLGPVPAVDLVNPIRLPDQPLLAGHAGMIGHGPGVKIGHPGLNGLPGGLVRRAQPRLGQQLGGQDARLVHVAVPKVPRQAHPRLNIHQRAPLPRQVVQHRVGNAQIGPGGLVIGGHLSCFACIGARLKCGQRLVQGHSTVTDLARLRGWSTSVPLATAAW